MSFVTSRSYLDYFRIVITAILIAAATCLVVFTYHWPLVGDPQVLHYGNFLISKGLAPYRDIVDMNMPGAYMVEGGAMHLFGGSDMAWRIYDFTLLGVLCGAMTVIARPYDWIAGLFAGVMFSLVHVSEGALDAAQRDEEMAVLIVVGCAFLFEAVRRSRPWMMASFGVCLGMASAVKPTVAPFAFVLLLMAWWNLRKTDTPARPYVWRGLLGGLLAAAMVVGYLFHYHAIGAFFEITRRITPYYAALNPRPLSWMLRMSLPRAALLMLPFALVVAFIAPRWKTWERGVLLLGIVLGAFSYYAQGKGYLHHRYVMVCFVLLWVALELSRGMRETGWIRVISYTGMAVGALLMVPVYTHRVALVQVPNGYTTSLESDLKQLGADRLQRTIQCFDLVEGCFTVLYHLQLVPATGNLGDMLLFSPGHGAVPTYYRTQMWNELHRNQPLVLVLSNDWYINSNTNKEFTFEKLNAWPQFEAFLDSDYRLVVERRFEDEDHHAYRIYLRKGIEFPPLGQPAAEQSN
jgi:hypothetical protein